LVAAIIMMLKLSLCIVGVALHIAAALAGENCVVESEKSTASALLQVASHRERSSVSELKHRHSRNSLREVFDTLQSVDANGIKNFMHKEVTKILHRTGLRQDPDSDKDGEPLFVFTPGYWLGVLTTWTFLLALTLAVYFCYYRTSSPVPQRTAEEPIADLDKHLETLMITGHWRCFEDANICMCSFCCPSLRWADTMSLAKLLTFWVAFALFFGVEFVSSVIFGSSIGLLYACLMLYFRHQLRDKIGVESWTFLSLFRDFCFLCWCPCCAIAQEARIVRDAIENGHENFPPEKSP
jgi:Cys-rich protein (TIGR01571 family)